MASQKIFWLRCETKEFERRSALTPSTAKQLIQDRFKIYVERDQQRIFDDEEFARYVRTLSLSVPVRSSQIAELAAS